MSGFATATLPVMEHVPEKRQSVAPSRWVLVGLLATLMVMAAVWFAVSWAVESGSENCPSQRESGAVAERCR